MYAQIFDAVDAGLIVLDPSLRILDWNRWMINQTEFEKKVVKHRSLYEFYPEIKAPWFERSFRSVLKFGNYAFYSQKLHGYLIPIPRRHDNSNGFLYMQQNCTLGPVRDEDGNIDGLFLMIQDVTEIAEYERRLCEVAKTDGLTGVYNRGAFESHLATEFSRKKRYNRQLSLILLDIDYFKTVNDSYGHQKGDEVIRYIAHLLYENVRASDFLARYGGEEFAIILPETDIESAYRVAEKVRRLVETVVFCKDDCRFQVSVSLGVAMWDPSMQSADSLVAAADRSLYQAKSAGRNRVCVEGKLKGNGAQHTQTGVRI
jgi:diguanylate cyclase (GGDEF)-like protein/PAS domain S-box-containing protein